jgi:hypothetical protein
MPAGFVICSKCAAIVTRPRSGSSASTGWNVLMSACAA